MICESKKQAYNQLGNHKYINKHIIVYAWILFTRHKIDRKILQTLKIFFKLPTTPLSLMQEEAGKRPFLKIKYFFKKFSFICNFYLVTKYTI